MKLSIKKEDQYNYSYKNRYIYRYLPYRFKNPIMQLKIILTENPHAYMTKLNLCHHLIKFHDKPTGPFVI